MNTRAAVLRRSADPGEVGPEAFSGISIEDVTVDEPREGEVLVDVVAASLCHSDLSVLTGDRPRPLPMVLGHETSGVVRSTGPDVTSVREGQHVLTTFVPACGRCRYCTSSRPALCRPANKANTAGTLITGRRPFHDADGHALYQHLGVSGFSEQTVVAEETLVILADDIPLNDAALFGCAVLTGVGAVANTASMRPGSRVAIFGCGGVGLAAVMGARALGAGQIIAVDVDPEKIRRAVELGADHGVEVTDETPEQVISLTGGGVDYAFDASGVVQAIEQAYASTQPGGQVIVIGLVHPAKRLEISPTDLVATERTIRGSYMGSTVPRRDIPWMLDLYRNGRLPVGDLVAETIRLQQIQNGMRALQTGVSGRIVLNI